MTTGLIETAARSEGAADSRSYGVAVAQVVANLDPVGLGRVQLRLRAGLEPWARVAAPMAGPGRGTFFIPQVGDEVLVAFDHGNVREPYVIGALWNGQDRPPAVAPTDAITKRIIRTPLGHELEFDDASGSIRITTSARQRISLGPTSIEITTSGGTATVSCATDGRIAIEGTASLTLKAPAIAIEGDTVDIRSRVRTTIEGGQVCDIRAALVKLN
jgi:phage baseplate assembly protein V